MCRLDKSTRPSNKLSKTKLHSNLVVVQEGTFIFESVLGEYL
jgi:hypothetical protein